MAMICYISSKILTEFNHFYRCLKRIGSILQFIKKLCKLSMCIQKCGVVGGPNKRKSLIKTPKTIYILQKYNS